MDKEHPKILNSRVKLRNYIEEFKTLKNLFRLLTDSQDI